MEYEELNLINFNKLKQMARNMGLKIRRSKEDIIKDIAAAFDEYNTYKTEKLDKYTRKHQLGEKGKEGTTYLVVTADGKEYAMKTFRKQKSSVTLRREANLQKMAADAGVAPNVIDIDTVSKYIVMEKMDSHLYDLLKKQKGVLLKKYQKQIIYIYKKLDQARVFHGDVNLMNYMLKGGKLYIIDFGMAKETTLLLTKKLGTSTPNINIMTLGMILKLIELKCPPSSYEYLRRYLTDDQRREFKL